MASLKPLRGTRILSLSLNLPGPAAVMRLKALGANCTKLESPAGDPMLVYAKSAYTQMHEGVKIVTADLKTERGLAKLHKLLAKTDVLLTSFRPSALARLGLAWKQLRIAHPHLNLVSIVGDTAAPEVPGHDLTYMAEHGLITSLELPPTLFADMGGSLLAVEAVLAAVIHQRSTGRSSQQSVGLSQAAQYLALPRGWGLTTPEGLIGGAHAFYQVMPCKDGRVAIAALEPHFASRFAALVGHSPFSPKNALDSKLKIKAHAFMKRHTCLQLQMLAEQHDLPFHLMRKINNRAPRGAVLEQPGLLIGLLILSSLVLHILPNLLLVPVFAHCASEVSISPELASPQLLLDLRASSENLSCSQTFDDRHNLCHAISRH